MIRLLLYPSHHLLEQITSVSLDRYGCGIPWNTFHYNDILWDGRDCHSTSTCCSLHNPPYFTKTLSQTTIDDLELRMYLDESASHENIVELYVKRMKQAGDLPVKKFIEIE